jgi:hypothetical protein
VTVRASNPAQVAAGYPAYAGYTQLTCGNFVAAKCGDHHFTAKANSEYILARPIVCRCHHFWHPA